jgi:hypothetical protein
MDTPDVKTCNDCKKVKPLGDFYRREGSRDGLFNSCKTCMYAYHKQWAIDNKERNQAHKAKWEAAHSEQRKLRYKKL